MFIVIIIISFGSIYVKAKPSSISSEISAKVNVKVADLGRHFQKFGIERSIIIYDSKNNLTYEHNPRRNATAMTPASTFKISNTLTALETG
ncbi:hypothetical protein [Trichormus azollae]|uniref:hypothetical protein n=1 Tax=Trichormus azollae TaxID=1164 RepID=UPI00325C3F07